MTDVLPLFHALDRDREGAPLCGRDGFVTTLNEAITCGPCRDLQCWHYVHRAVEDGLPQQYVLCGHAGEFHNPSGAIIVNLTILPERVTCPVCMEWLHA